MKRNFELKASSGIWPIASCKCMSGAQENY